MSSYLAQFDKGVLVVGLVFLSTGVVCIVAILASVWYKSRLHEQECSLKREMVEKGYTVEEIEKVIQSSKFKD